MISVIVLMYYQCIHVFSMILKRQWLPDAKLATAIWTPLAFFDHLSSHASFT